MSIRHTLQLRAGIMVDTRHKAVFRLKSSWGCGRVAIEEEPQTKNAKELVTASTSYLESLLR